MKVHFLFLSPPPSVCLERWGDREWRGQGKAMFPLRVILLFLIKISLFCEKGDKFFQITRSVNSLELYCLERQAKTKSVIIHF